MMKTLAEIAAAYEKANEAAREYFDRELAPRLDSCRTVEEVVAIQNEVSRGAADEHGGMRDLPAAISVGFILALSRVRTVG